MNSLLKIIAVVTMICDHVGLLFYPEIEIFRIIGRLSLPIFCYMISEGYKYTKNFKKYVILLLALAVISEIPYLMLGTMKLNILFSFVLALIILYVKDYSGGKYNVDRFAYVLVYAAVLLNVEYGVYPLLLIIIFYEFGQKKLLSFSLVLVITFIYAISINVIYQIVAALSVFIIWYVPKVKFKINKYVFYPIYPIQWVILILIKVYVIQ